MAQRRTGTLAKREIICYNRIMTIQEIISEIQKITSVEGVKELWSAIVKHHRFLRQDYFREIEKTYSIKGARVRWAKKGKEIKEKI